MSKNLVIVESPSKSKTIEKYLGSDYKVLSSKGHIRDLSTSGKYGFGVDLEDNYKPDYKIIKGKKKLVVIILCVLILAIGGVVGFLVLGNNNNETNI